MGNVLEFFPPFNQSPRCVGCEEPHGEIGVLCKECRENQEPVAASFVQGTIASAIADLRREQNKGAPLAGLVADALGKMRRAYDAFEPLIEISGRGYTEVICGDIYAIPERGVTFGPFPNEEAAQDAITAWHAKAKPVVT